MSSPEGGGPTGSRTPDSRAVLVAKKLKARLCELADRFVVHDIRIFGSYARGDWGPESDLDVYVEIEPADSAARQTVSDVAWEVGFEAGIVVSPIVFPHDAVQHGPLKYSPLYELVRKEGFPI